MYWYHVSQVDIRARRLADRHYNRRKPGCVHFCSPGRNIVLIVPGETGATALWVSSYQAYRKDGFQCWDNTYFRNESGIESSALIQQAMMATCWLWPAAPRDGMHSFIDPRHVKPTIRRGVAMYGYCYLKAGWELYPDRTKDDGLWRWILPQKDVLQMAAAPPNYEYQQLRLAL